MENSEKQEKAKMQTGIETNSESDADLVCCKTVDFGVVSYSKTDRKSCKDAGGTEVDSSYCN
jgi:hypothetical protein